MVKVVTPRLFSSRGSQRIASASGVVASCTSVAVLCGPVEPL